MNVDKVPQFVRNDIDMFTRVIGDGEEYETVIDVADGVLLEVVSNPETGIVTQYRIIVSEPKSSYLTVESVRGNPNQTIIGQLAYYLQEATISEGLGKSVTFTEESTESEGTDVYVAKVWG